MHSTEFARGEAERPRRRLAAICGAIAAISVLWRADGGQLDYRPSRRAARSAKLSRGTCRELYDRGLNFLASTQREDGGWPNSMQDGAGTVGMGLMVFLASGEIRTSAFIASTCGGRCVTSFPRRIPKPGFWAKACTTTDSACWPWPRPMVPLTTAISGRKARMCVRSAALELAVRAAITSQKNNSQGEWRYSPDSTDADTSVSGAVLVGLLAARNAGIEIPDQSIDKAISFIDR